MYTIRKNILILMVGGLLIFCFDAFAVDYWQYTYDCDVLPNSTDAIQKIRGASEAFVASSTDPSVIYLI